MQAALDRGSICRIRDVLFGSEHVLTTAHRQEGLSRSFLHALAATAGANITIDRAYDYGVDCTINPVSDGRRRVETGFPIEFQLKSTKNWSESEHYIEYDLEAKTYNDLVSRHALAIPLYLAVLCLPPHEKQWFISTERYQKIRKCCYFYKPTGSITKNSSTIRIKIPRANLLTPQNLNRLLMLARRSVGA